MASWNDKVVKTAMFEAIIRSLEVAVLNEKFPMKVREVAARQVDNNNLTLRILPHIGVPEYFTIKITKNV